MMPSMAHPAVALLLLPFSTFIEDDDGRLVGKTSSQLLYKACVFWAARMTPSYATQKNQNVRWRWLGTGEGGIKILYEKRDELKGSDPTSNVICSY